MGIVEDGITGNKKTRNIHSVAFRVLPECQ
ncbi:hypothetical protein RKD28_000496 [Streptomyces sp. SAI-229]|jgi:hypothetical protein